ncbi:MAG: hypothetical protein K2Q45_03920 [Nitrosomonas sp.]|nr:hypothetical protein [Nitrosomonas sp.]
MAMLEDKCRGEKIKVNFLAATFYFGLHVVSMDASKKIFLVHPIMKRVSPSDPTYIMENVSVSPMYDERESFRSIIKTCADVTKDSAVFLEMARYLYCRYKESQKEEEAASGECEFCGHIKEEDDDETLLPANKIMTCVDPEIIHEGDYVLATRWMDASPHDPWYVGFVEKVDHERRAVKFVATGERWFSNVCLLTQEEGDAIIKKAKPTLF